jgi:hypothetical protein
MVGVSIASSSHPVLSGYPASFQAVTPPLRTFTFLYPIPIYLAA